jgi:hypothetical protein
MSGRLSVTWLPGIWQTRLQADVISWIVGRINLRPITDQGDGRDNGQGVTGATRPPGA